MAAVEVREATPEDAPAVAAVAEACWARDYPKVLNRENVEDAAREWYDPARTREEITSPRHLVFVATDGEVCGFVHAYDDRDTGVVLRVYVDPERRGEEIGSRLVGRACDALFDRGCERVTATVLEANDAGRAFYESLGFEETGDTGETEIAGEFYLERTYATRDRPEG